MLHRLRFEIYAGHSPRGAEKNFMDVSGIARDVAFIEVASLTQAQESMPGAPDAARWAHLLI